MESVTLQQGNWSLEGTLLGFLVNLLQLRWEGALQVTLSGLHIQLRTPTPAKPRNDSRSGDGSGSGIKEGDGQASKPKKRKSGVPKEIALPAWLVNALPGFGIRVDGIKVTHSQVCGGMGKLAGMGECEHLV